MRNIYVVNNYDNSEPDDLSNSSKNRVERYKWIEWNGWMNEWMNEKDRCARIN